ncbi:MAG: hypothetical protein U0Q07_02985 [Acidimicrobiales bacterium]
MNAWVLVLFLAPLFVTLAVLRNHQGRVASRAATVELVADGFGIRRVLADGREEGVDWSDVNEVEVVTAKKGPHGAYGGVVMIGDGGEHGVLVPFDRLEDTGALAALTTLPRFPMPAFVEAMQLDPPSRTLVWTRPGHDVQPAGATP